TLLPRPGGARQREDPFVAGRALSFVGAFCGDERVGIQIARIVPHRIFAKALDIRFYLSWVVTGSSHLYLGAIHPERIDADIEQSLFNILEVDPASFRAVGIVDAGAFGDPVQRFV